MTELGYDQKTLYSKSNIFKFLLCSFIGIFVFFITVNFNGKSTIPIDHMSTLIQNLLGPTGVKAYGLIIIILGTIYPFYKKTWNKNTFSIVFSVLKILGLIISVMICFNFGPSILLAPDIGNSVFGSTITLAIVIPTGAVFLSFLTNYGLLEFFGIVVQPVMRPVFKTPGRSSLDAVASFVGSYSVGLMITNRMYKEGKYNIKEAAIIALGFSTVSTPFMIVVCKTLGIMELWNFYFWSTMFITFAVTAITVRLWPISKKPEEYYDGKGDPEPIYKGNRLKIAFNEAMAAAGRGEKLGKNVVSNLKDGFLMAMGLLPAGVALKAAGLLASKHTPLFDYLGYVFYPLFKLFQSPEPLLAGKAAALSVVEVFIAVLLVVKAALITKYIIAVIAVSAIIMFAGTVPCIMATDIPITIKDILVVWVQRLILTILLAGVIGLIFL